MSTAHAQEQTFRQYTQSQGETYAQNRAQYHQILYDAILNYHKGPKGLLLDIGCGPGRATRTLAPHFDQAVGLDPSPGMISTAIELLSSSSPTAGSVTGASAGPIRFAVSTAEELGSCHLDPPVAPRSVDLIIAAAAAHWFDMPRFWRRAELLLRPGGTVALWCSGSVVVFSETPNAAAVQRALDEHRERLADYYSAGNDLARELYRDLPLPWTVAGQESPGKEHGFDEAAFVRKEWGTDAPGAEPADKFYEGGEMGRTMGVPTALLEAMIGTASPVTRWREAHPDLVGTEQDVVRVLRRTIERAMHDAGVEPGKEIVKGGISGVLLLLRKKD